MNNWDNSEWFDTWLMLARNGVQRHPDFPYEPLKTPAHFHNNGRKTDTSDESASLQWSVSE